MEDDEESFEDDEIYSIVIDNGSYMIKAGFGCDDAPRSVVPTKIAKDSRPNSKNSPFCCDQIYSLNRYHRSYRISDPIKKGCIQNMGDMECIWRHLFYNELRIGTPNEVDDAYDIGVLLIDKPLNSTKQREEMMQIILEKWKFPKFHIMADVILSLFASRKVTGIVVDVGYDSANIACIQECKYVRNSVKQLSVGGMNITKHLETLLTERGYTFPTVAEREIVKDIKEKLCYVTKDYEAEIYDAEHTCGQIERNYELPDGQVITLGNYERFNGPEVLFKPNLMGCDDLGIHEAIMCAVMDCRYDVRKEMLSNVVLSGATTMFNGMHGRIKTELEIFERNGYFVDTKLLTGGYLRELASSYDNICCKDICGVVSNNIDKMENGSGWQVKLIANPEREYSTWIGGSILTSLSTFEELWILQEEYNEYGMHVLDKKCHDFI